MFFENTPGYDARLLESELGDWGKDLERHFNFIHIKLEAGLEGRGRLGFEGGFVGLGRVRGSLKGLGGFLRGLGAAGRGDVIRCPNLHVTGQPHRGWLATVCYEWV